MARSVFRCNILGPQAGRNEALGLPLPLPGSLLLQDCADLDCQLLLVQNFNVELDNRPAGFGHIPDS
jgi:hypothetical protein